jgi:hypothetical protein
VIERSDDRAVAGAARCYVGVCERVERRMRENDASTKRPSHTKCEGRVPDVAARRPRDNATKVS